MTIQDLSDLSVALVDDQRDFTNLVCTIFRSFGVRDLSYFQKGSDLIGRMKSYRFDILFTDIRMPEMNGIDLIRTIRGDEKLLCRGLPIICISAHAERSSIATAIAAGADDFLVKPVRPVDIYSRLIAHLTNPIPRIKTTRYFGPDPARRANSQPRDAA